MYRTKSSLQKERSILTPWHTQYGRLSNRKQVILWLHHYSVVGITDW